MKKSKLFQSALSLMLVGGMLTACGSSASSTAASTAASTGSNSTAASTASDSAAPAATKQYVIGIAEAQANDEVTALTWKISSPPLTTSSSSSPRP